MLWRWPQVLADGQDVALHCSQVGHCLDDLRPVLPEAEHHAGLGDDAPGQLLGLGNVGLVDLAGEPPDVGPRLALVDVRNQSSAAFHIFEIFAPESFDKHLLFNFYPV